MDNILLDMSLASILFLIILLTLILIILLRGAPYVPSQEKTIRQMILLAGILPGERAIDLGSGDGRVVIALARAGAEAHGYEINPLLVWLGRRKIRKEGLEKVAFIHFKDFWSVDFSAFDMVRRVCVFIDKLYSTPRLLTLPFIIASSKCSTLMNSSVRCTDSS